MQHSITDWFVIFVTNISGVRIFEIRRYRWYHSIVSKYGRQINEFDTFINEWNFDKESNVVIFRINVTR